jgi:hypothetical protein
MVSVQEPYGSEGQGSILVPRLHLGCLFTTKYGTKLTIVVVRKVPVGFDHKLFHHQDHEAKAEYIDIFLINWYDLIPVGEKGELVHYEEPEAGAAVTADSAY